MRLETWPEGLKYVLDGLSESTAKTQLTITSPGAPPESGFQRNAHLFSGIVTVSRQHRDLLEKLRGRQFSLTYPPTGETVRADFLKCQPRSRAVFGWGQSGPRKEMWRVELGFEIHNR